MLRRAIKSSEEANGEFPPSYYIEQELLQALRDADKSFIQANTITSYASSLGRLLG